MFQQLRAPVLTCLLAVSLPSAAADASLLKPPPGAKVAVVVFEDLQSPECARAYAMVWEAANAHKVPVVLHDFPLPRHNWAFEAAIWARYFDQTSASLGNGFRKFIYANQPQITRENLQQWVQRFGEENKTTVTLPNDADGRLAEKVKSDFALGQRIGIEHSLTLWVVSNSGASQPLVEDIKDGQLGPLIESMLKKEQAVPAKGAPQKGALPKQSAGQKYQESRMNQE
jgi:Thioredoxin